MEDAYTFHDFEKALPELDYLVAKDWSGALVEELFQVTLGIFEEHIEGFTISEALEESYDAFGLHTTRAADVRKCCSLSLETTFSVQTSKSFQNINLGMGIGIIWTLSLFGD